MRALCLIAIMSLAACNDCKPRVDQIAVAPDGTVLWQDYCTGVYFSTAGTQYELHHWKTTETVRVPNAER